MITSAPTVLISSTCFDLSQVRRDLHDFLEHQLGYRVLASEFSSFPIDPDVDTVENCRRRVERDTDVLVLIVGGRYGYTPQDGGRSVTNLEYLTARAKGIPIYAFVDAAVLPLLPVWETNPSADFSGSVDNPRVFQFIREIRAEHKVWTTSFSSAQDIIGALRQQFSHIMREGLRWFATSREHGGLEELQGLSARSYRIALEKSLGWEVSLFSQVLSEEFRKVSDLRRAYDLGIAIGPGETISDLETGRWMQRKLSELSRLMEHLNALITEHSRVAFREPGVVADPPSIAFVARQIAAVYTQEIEWTQRIRRAHVSPKFTTLFEILAQITLHDVEMLGNAPAEMRAELDRVLSADTKEKPTYSYSFNIELTGVDDLMAESQHLAAELDDWLDG